MKNFLQRVGQFFQTKEQTIVPFKLIFADFKKILNLNNQILDLIADANDKLSGDYIFDEQYIHSTCHQLTDLVRELIVLINHLTQQKYSDLYSSFHHIDEKIETILQGVVLCPVKDFILPYSSITRDLIDAVGGKNANLAEIGSVLGFHIPDGFAITTAAFSAFWLENNLEEKVAAIIEQWQQKAISDEEMAWEIQRMIFDSTVPAKLKRDMLDAAGSLSKGKLEATPHFAVRSSAQGEDGISSFAGQYRSCLNIPLKNLPQAYKEVVASLYSPEAMEYRRRKDFRANEIKMSVACQLMISAKTSGVMYSYDPVLPEEETLVISSAWGLGEPIVSGKISTDLFVLDRQPPHAVKEVQVVRKEQSMSLHGSGGIVMESVREEQRTQPSLKNQQLKELAIFDSALIDSIDS